MKETQFRERPFEFLRRKDYVPFPEETVRNWYIARAYVLDKLKDVSFPPNSTGHLSVVVDGDSPLMLSVLRQTALSAHYLNFEEYDRLGRQSCRNRTVITLVSRMEASGIIGTLEKEEYLCNLLKYCKHSVFGTEHNGTSCIDLEIHIAGQAGRESGNTVWMDEDDINGFLQRQAEDSVFTIDTRKAVLTHRVYQLGGQIDNLPAEDIHCAERYSHALDTFRYRLLRERISPMVDEKQWKENPTAVKNGLSDIFCSDCFEARLSDVKNYARALSIPMEKAWESIHEPLSCCEHHRWIVEKLIMGYRPLNAGERIEYERLFGKERTYYVSRLKKDPCSPALIDLCSYRDLRRIDPDNMKYDSILLLAIPLILEKA